MKNILLVSAISSVLILPACSSDDAAQIIADEFVNVSGQVKDINDATLSGVTVEGVYTSPGGLLNPSTTTDGSGNYALSVIKGDALYLHASKSTYATVNSAKEALNANETGVDIDGIPLITEAQGVIDLALFVSSPPLADKAWLVVDVVAATNGDDIAGQTITPAPAPPAAVYTNCFGAPDVGGVTVASCMGGRPGPMYIASFDTATETEITVTVGSETQTAVVRKGEITGLEFEQ